MADLRGARLTSVNLDRVNLRWANLSSADLVGASLCRADMIMADLSATNLQNANLEGAILDRVNFRGAKLDGTIFKRALVGFTIFADVDLSCAEGLGDVLHVGPSAVGIDTYYRSHGNIPEAFLIGAGVPDGFLKAARSLFDLRGHFYTCFISYSTHDQRMAERLHSELQANGVRCWFAPHDIQAGKKLDEQIGDAISRYDRLLLILSEHSISSEWVKTEIAHARRKEINQKRRVLFPIRLVPFATIRDWQCFDADAGKDSAREIREYFIPDFSNWTDDGCFNKAFQRLLKDLVL